MIIDDINFLMIKCIMSYTHTPYSTLFKKFETTVLLAKQNITNFTQPIQRNREKSLLFNTFYILRLLFLLLLGGPTQFGL